MREAHVGDSEQRVTGLHCFDTDLPGPDECVARDNLFDDIHRARFRVRSPTPGSPAGQPGWGGAVREGNLRHRALAYARASDTLDWRRSHLARQARFVVIEESAVLDDRPRDRIETFGEFVQRDLFAATNTFDQSE